jgi:tRNA A37 threonylcarbamoyladenosine dehydratase
MSKVQVLTERLKEINPNIILLNKDWYFGEKDSDLSDIMQADFIFYAADCYYNISSMRFLLKQVIKLGIPLIDCPVNLTGGYVRIETKNDLDHFDWTTQNLIQ